jgi:hypothetical protein
MWDIGCLAMFNIYYSSSAKAKEHGLFALSQHCE